MRAVELIRACLLVGGAALCGAAFASPLVVAVGDSNTEGWIDGTLQPELAYPARLQDLLGADYDVANAGRSGDTSADALDRFNDAVTAQHPTVTILALGLNDLRPSERGAPFVTVQHYQANLRVMQRTACSIGSAVIFVTPPPVDSARAAVWLGPTWPVGTLRRRYAEAMQALSAAEQLTCIDLAALFARGTTDFLGPDGMHLSARGHETLARALGETLTAGQASCRVPAPTPNRPGLRIAPNPMPGDPNGRLVFHYILSQPSAVTLQVYDVRGRRVAVLLDGAPRPAGSHFEAWPPRRADGLRTATGTYVAILTARHAADTASRATAKFQVLN